MKFNWGHGVMVALGAFMIFIVSLIFIADETGDLISEEYYEESLVYQEQGIDARNRAYALEEQPQVISQANGYNIQFPKSIQPDSGQVYLMRGAFKKDDIVMPLEMNSRNEFLVPAARMNQGEYDLSLTWYTDGKPFLIKKTLEWNMP